jgi:hypothetical protein
MGEWRYSSMHSLTSALDGGEWLASSPGRFTLRERAPGTHWIGGWVGPSCYIGPNRNSTNSFQFWPSLWFFFLKSFQLSGIWRTVRTGMAFVMTFVHFLQRNTHKKFPITLASLFIGRRIFHHSNTGIRGSNPARSTDVYPRVFMLSHSGSDVLMVPSPMQGFLWNVCQN